MRNHRLLLGGLLAALLATSALARPEPPAPASGLDRALEATVRISGRVQVWRGDRPSPEVVDWHGTGWTAACDREGAGYRVLVRTAAHVLDVLDLLEPLEGEGPLRLQADFEVLYRDGALYRVGLTAVTWEEGDSATLTFPSPGPRVALAAGDPDRVRPGDRLRIVACPGPLEFAVGEGVLAAAPADFPFWLATLPVAPGSSGGPVLDDEGRVVAHAVGLLRWPWGEVAVLQPGRDS